MNTVAKEIREGVTNKHELIVTKKKLYKPVKKREESASFKNQQSTVFSAEKNY